MGPGDPVVREQPVEVSKWGELKVSLQGEIRMWQVQCVPHEVKVRREAAEEKRKMFCADMMQRRTFCNCNVRKNRRKEEDFRSVREGERVELVPAWAWESRERTAQVCMVGKHKETAAAQPRKMLLSRVSCWRWRWSSGNSFGWKLCWKITEPLPHCSRSSLWTVSPWGQEIKGAGDAFHKTGKLWEAGSLVQTWRFTVAN